MRRLVAIGLISCAGTLVQADEPASLPNGADAAQMKALAEREAELTALQNEVAQLRRRLGAGEEQLSVQVKMIELSHAALRVKGIELKGKTALQAFAPAESNQSVVPVVANETDGAMLKQIESWIADPTKPAKLLASPTITTPLGKAASVRIGKEFPITVPGSFGTTSIEYRFYGKQLDVVGTKTDDGNLDLKVRPRFSEIDPTRSVKINGHTVPGMHVRECDTHLTIRPGQTVVIGGLIQTRAMPQPPERRRGKPESALDEMELIVVIKADLVRPQPVSPPAEVEADAGPTVTPIR